MAQNIKIAGATYPAVPSITVPKAAGGTASYVDTSDATATADKIMNGYTAYVDGSKVTGTGSGGDQYGTIWQDGEGYVHLDDESGIALESKSVTPSESQQVVEAGEGYYALDKVTVGAISTTYVGSGIARKSSSDLTVSGATVMAPAGYYSTQASKSVASGTAGTPTATKGTVSNHAVTVTPKVTNTTGYISGGTKTGTGISVSASELVSGTYSVTSAGVKDVANYSAVDVPAGSAGTPTATKGSVSNNSVTVTPSVTNTTGFIGGTTKTGTAVTVSASELVSGTYTVASSGTRDVTNYASIYIPAGTEGTPTATKGSVYNNSVSVTPSVDNAKGFIGGNSITGTAVTVTASELVRGTKSITENGTGIDVTNYASVDVDVPTGGFQATITHTVGSGYVYPSIYVNGTGTSHYSDGDTFYFKNGDTLDINLAGTLGGGRLYVNSSLVYSSDQGAATYTWTPPACDLTIVIETTSEGEVYITYPVLLITENGTHNVSGYGEANVNVAGEDEPIAVNFLDYDGTVLYSYTKSEALALTELPANPSHTGLTAQGWNYTIEQMNSEISAHNRCDIGQLYVTNDGKTRLYCHFTDGKLHPYLGLCPNGTVTVDWGDNSTIDTMTGTSQAVRKSLDHEYASEGDYVITLTPTSGSFSFYGENGTSWVLTTGSFSTYINRSYSSSLKKVELGSNVSINAYAFNHCHQLKSITIPKNIVAFGNNAFYNCYLLTGITIPHGVTSIAGYTFFNCCSLTSISIPNAVTAIQNSVFYNCFSLAIATIPSSVKTIASSAFYGCGSLTEIEIPSGVVLISGVFEGCYSLDKITIPSTVTTISGNAFKNCSSLAKIELPSGITSISDGMLNGCRKIVSVVIPSDVTSIGSSAFCYCSALAKIEIPSGVTSIGSYAFQGCFSLDKIEIPSGVTSIGQYTFQNCYGLAEVEIPSSVTSIGSYAFQGCFSLAKIEIPSGVTSIGTYAFQSCYSLAKIEIPSGVTSIGNYVFSACYSLAKIEIPSGVTSIGNYAFQNCYGLVEIHFKSATPPTVSNSNAWSNIPATCKIYVPTGYLSAYTSATNYPSSSTYTYVEE